MKRRKGSGQLLSPKRAIETLSKMDDRDGSSPERATGLATLERAGLPATNVYKLRALYATIKARTVNDVTLKPLMRHTDIRTTKQYYASALDADLREAAT